MSINHRYFRWTLHDDGRRTSTCRDCSWTWTGSPRDVEIAQRGHVTSDEPGVDLDALSAVELREHAAQFALEDARDRAIWAVCDAGVES